jgi:hypothetical protein
MRCPGQDLRFWIPDDIATVLCGRCGREVEIWKDEPMRVCPGCGCKVRNPKLDLGCAEWCKYAAECLDGIERPPTESGVHPET